MKKVLVTLALIIGIVVTSYGQSNTVMIKSIETYGSFAAMAKNLHIINEEGVVRTIQLEKHNTKGILKNMVTIKKVLDSYLANGYSIISSNGVSFGWNSVFTIEHTYILKKKE